MNATRAALVERFARGRERVEKEQALILRVFDLLPTDLANDKTRIMTWGAGFEALIGLKGHTLSCVPRLLELLPPVERRMVRDGSVAFKPLCKLTDRDTTLGDVYHIAPFAVHISYGEVHADWFWQAEDDLLIQVRVEFANPAFLRVDAAHRYGRDDHVVEYRWDLSQQAKDWVRATGGDYIRFASGSLDSPKPFALYWPPYKDASEVFEGTP